MKFTINFLVLILGILLANGASAESQRVQFKKMVEQLQQSPNDNALREKVIRLAPKLKPAPALPDTAIAFEGRAQFAFKNAKSADDFLAAAQEYEKAVAAAPWVPGYYADLCTIYEKAGKLEDAKRHCGYYLTGLSDPAQINDVKRRIAGFEFGIEKVAAEKRRAEEEANSPRGRAAAMLAVLRKQYAGPVRQLLICGVHSNQYWHCTDDDARGTNWVDSMSVDAWPKPGVGPVGYKIVGAEGDLIKINLGTYSWPNGTLLDEGFRAGCAKPNGADPNSMAWVNCPSWTNTGALDVTVLFKTTSNGSPLIEFREGSAASCSSGDGCRRAQFILQPNP